MSMQTESHITFAIVLLQLKPICNHGENPHFSNEKRTKRLIHLRPLFSYLVYTSNFIFAFQISNGGRTKFFENRDFVKPSFQYQSSFSANTRPFGSLDSAVSPRRYASHKYVAEQVHRTNLKYRCHHSS